MPSPSLAPESIGSDKVVKTYQAGTLIYTFQGLMILFAWLLWGDFAFTIFQAIFTRFIPLYLADLHASNTLIGIMTGSVAGVVNLIFLPGMSRKSDEHRGRWGRRVPFLAVAAPVTAASLILTGYAPEIGGWIHARMISQVAPSISLTAVVLGLVSGFIVAFHYFNMMLCNAFSWLLRDVVPQVIMARFLSWFRIIATMSSVAFSWYVFPHVITHRKEVCVGIGLFYFVTFLLMCLNVKEGEYPPPPPVENKPGLIKSFGIYFRECLSVRIYRNYFIAYMVSSVADCAIPFWLLFYRNSLGFNMDGLGKIFAYGYILTAVTLLPMGWLCDKFSPFRIAAIGQAGMALVAILSYYFMNSQTLLLWTLIMAPIMVAWGLGSAAINMKLFPPQKFGQFFAATNIFGCAIRIVANYLIGIFMDLTHSNYRMTYLWFAVTGLAMIPLIMVERDWKRHGGPDNYVPPLPPES